MYTRKTKAKSSKVTSSSLSHLLLSSVSAAFPVQLFASSSHFFLKALAMAKLKIAGAWSGTLDVQLEEWTVSMLIEEVARRSNSRPDSINLICAGRVLKDADTVEPKKNLGQLGLKDNAKILATRVNAAEGQAIGAQLQAEEQRSATLARLKAAASALSKRHADGSLPIEDFNIELENQSGQTVNLGSETDQRAIMMGLMLHAKGKQLIRRHQIKDALEVLAMGEEAFSLCETKLIERIDNVPILQLDMVWCYFMLRDITLLSSAGVRLARARNGIERSHGKDASRVRLLQRGCSPELALYLRLELLEGVVAYHCGQLDKCRDLLTSAKAKFDKLQVSDEALSLLMSMGYKENEAKRALKMNNQDVESAVSFIVEEREKKAMQHADDIQRQKEIKEQKKYGKTPLGKAVDLPKLKYLVSIGFEQELAAEALRRNENDTHKSLDDLTNPEINSMIQNDIESKKRKRKHRKQEKMISELMSMGFERSSVIEAVQAHGTREGALNQLLSQPVMNDSDPLNHNSVGTSSGSAAIQGPVVVNEGEAPIEEGSSSSRTLEGAQEERDVEMENELAEGGDALADYDIDLTKEAEAIDEYIALLDSASTSGKLYT